MNLRETAELRDKLQRGGPRVGARMPVPNPDFEAALNRRLYIEQDPSQLIGRFHRRRHGANGRRGGRR